MELSNVEQPEKANPNAALFPPVKTLKWLPMSAALITVRPLLNPSSSYVNSVQTGL